MNAWYDEKGFGFLVPDAGGKDVFVHRSAITDGQALNQGDAVSWVEDWNNQKGNQKGRMAAGQVMGGVPQMKGGMKGGKDMGKGSWSGGWHGCGKAEAGPLRGLAVNRCWRPVQVTRSVAS